MKRFVLLMITALLFAPAVFADWVLQNDQSDLKFISVKNNNIAEISEFKQLAGSIDTQGNVDLIIDLASVDTKIAVRDERMKKVLFEVPTFSQAKLNGAVDLVRVKTLKIGQRYTTAVSLVLSLHGIENTVQAQVTVIKLADEALLVTSANPVILNARDYKLTTGIEMLRNLAGLSAINSTVPVMFNFVFK